MKITNENEASVIELPGRTLKVAIDMDKIGSDKMTFLFSIVPEGSAMPWHQHDTSDEIIYVLEGAGSAESRNQKEAINPGSIIYMEPGSEHRIVNEGSGEMRLICAFSPGIKISPPK